MDVLEVLGQLFTAPELDSPVPAASRTYSVDSDSALDSSEYSSRSSFSSEVSSDSASVEEEILREKRRRNHKRRQTNDAVRNQKRAIQRRSEKRADQVRSVFAISDLLQSCDALQLELCGYSEDVAFPVFGVRRRDMWSNFLQNEDSPDKVVVSVEVSSSRDRERKKCGLSRHADITFTFALSFIAGCSY